jgi:hypothetical protein
MRRWRTSPGAAVAGDRIYVAGGVTVNDGSFDEVETLADVEVYIP